ncbi:histidine kinase [Halorhabdus sp. CBA1104]|uniref:DICT sensory domain-containing protein n=1 Tax=unclassified Halorhabdus TaxID=2621901 RepID=UPI0012B385B0|nr:MULTISPECIES: DICT sensory domain-containing protein [unclassified Halorhabdus]QGN07015.1 histidine kinase [Halorhabdus sp. CBA1104]
MDIHGCIEAINNHEKELVLFNVGNEDRLGEHLADFFETQNVRISTARTASGRPAEVAVLSAVDGVLAVLDGSLLRQLVTETNVGANGVGFADTEYEAILKHLKETTFTSTDRSQLHHASREIEDRARRVGSGTLYAGFQRFSLMADQSSIYADIARRGVTVHAFGVPDDPAPDLGGAQVHAVETDEIATTWFVIFDGGDETAQETALLAEQRGPEQFYGAWTYDAMLVDRVRAHLETEYVCDSDISTSGPQSNEPGT